MPDSWPLLYCQMLISHSVRYALHVCSVAVPEITTDTADG